MILVPPQKSEITVWGTLFFDVQHLVQQSNVGYY